MAKAKKYYWLKLEKNFFKRHDIKIIEAMEDGKEFALFYLKLLLESLSHEGNLRFSDTIPYDYEMLATITNTKLEIVERAIKIFIKLNMLEIYEDETIHMNETQKLLGIETDAARKKREYREKQDKEGQDEDNVRQNKKEIEEQELQIKTTDYNYNNNIAIFFENELIKQDLLIDEQKKNKMLNSFSKNIDSDATETVIQKYIRAAVRNEKSQKIANEVFEQCRNAIKEYYQVISSRFSTKEAKLKIASALKNNADPQEIILGYQNYLKSNKGTDIKYIKNFVVFINQEVWKDFIDWKESDNAIEERADTFDDLKHQYFGD